MVYVSAAPIPDEDIATFKAVNRVAQAQGELGYWLFAIGFVLQLAEPVSNAVNTISIFFRDKRGRELRTKTSSTTGQK